MEFSNFELDLMFGEEPGPATEVAPPAPPRRGAKAKPTAVLTFPVRKGHSDPTSPHPDGWPSAESAVDCDSTDPVDAVATLVLGGAKPSPTAANAGQSLKDAGFSSSRLNQLAAEEPNPRSPEMRHVPYVGGAAPMCALVHGSEEQHLRQEA
ncbi:hypothetical protein GPECTOR_56g438 [Gonium pectorale]|uniref:Uncharacterized protein n=1 Tax=Gonium pectorale TaxID=33097 RepID=A0A150G682_GONPE|nr:hypothetical protein GPECTOR_56g438 [Gonium pectorale]|eukprot:KXZ45341.1 hypothetical protein GPECTOR_56g438 [Gonium pectorale]